MYWNEKMNEQSKMNTETKANSPGKFTTEAKKEQFILIAIDTGSGDTETSLDELALLTDTVGAEVSGRLTQARENPNPRHYLGKGKLEDLKDLISLKSATGIICDDELTNTQIKNLEEVLKVKVIDRTLLILDIFAGRANTAEGKVQVELAQQRYNLSHLAGIGKALSRLGGGIGTRGPGEKKLETDRRHIRDRIAELNRELEKIEINRGVLRERREKNGIPIVSMVGYTNAGKSTLMNALTGAGVFVEDKLFATLDTTTRKLTLPGHGTRASGADILLTDTVGFINKLPHQLIRAFRSTLEELKYADILLHVVDASQPNADSQMAVVTDTLSALNCSDKLIITVYNKMDKTQDTPIQHGSKPFKTVCVSALNGTGFDDLTLAIEEALQGFAKKITVLIPFTDGHIVNQIHTACEIINEEHLEDGTLIELFAKPELIGRLNKYLYGTDE